MKKRCEFKNGRRVLTTHEELSSGCWEVECVAVDCGRENDLRAAQRHEFCLRKAARARDDAR